MAAGARSATSVRQACARRGEPFGRMSRHRVMGRLRFVAILLGCLLAACTPSATRPTPTRVQATSGHLTLAAEPAVIRSGQQVGLQLTVAGPLDYYAGCIFTEHLWAVDSQGRKVWEQPVDIDSICGESEVGPPQPIARHLADGSSLTYEVNWQTAANFKAGIYAVHGAFLASRPSLVAPVISIQIS